MSTAAKRASNGLHAARRHYKRQKLADNPKKKVEVDVPKPPPADEGPLSLDALARRDVDLPDRLDDAEGFFGLEEIDDVDVIRDLGCGRVEYKVRLLVRISIGSD